MASDFTYQFTDKARTDLDDAVSYMAVTLGSPASAKAFIDKIEEAIEDLCMFPKRGPAVFNEYIRISGIRKKAVGNYLIYYLPDEQAKLLYILRIVYGKRDTERILSELEL